MAGVVSIAPFYYIHVLDNNTNVARVIAGPIRFTPNESEKVIEGPVEMVKVPPRCYVEILNPHVRKADGTPEEDDYGQVKLSHGDTEFRLHDDFPEPFPLYPGEKQNGVVEFLTVVEKNNAIRLRASRNFTDTNAAGEVFERQAGDEWLFEGPGTYIPRVEVEQVEAVTALVVSEGQALQLRARRATVDQSGVARKAGAEWLVRAPGAYLPGVDEQLVRACAAHVITRDRALHLRAKRAFMDCYKIPRKAGEEWLVTLEETDSHIIDVDEELVGSVEATTLTNQQYAVVLNPVVKGKQLLGAKQLRHGPASFFLSPGEELEDGIQEVVVLADDEALLLQAVEEFEEEVVGDSAATAAPPPPDGEEEGAGEAKRAEGGTGKVLRRPGDRWMVYGPRDYVPPVSVEVVETRKAIPLDLIEGIYVRDARSGQVRAVVGETYMLKPTEELWEKELPPEVERLLAKQRLGQNFVPPAAAAAGEMNLFTPDPEEAPARDKTRVVTFRAAENSAVQVYDYKQKAARVVFGPDLILLMPDEQFSVLSLSGDKPKRPNVITSLCLNLGPDFMTDVIAVETSDHARLRLKLSYNWHFDVGREDPDREKIFSVRDFTGDACKTIASRVRGAVAMETFDNFHKHSARVIRVSVFGEDEMGKIKGNLVFCANSLVITNVDIQSVEPVEEDTRLSLQKSVQMAIEITTKSQEARARHDAHREEEEAKGLLQQQKLKNEAQAEESRKRLLALRAESAAIETSGQAQAEAKARAQAAGIEGEAAVERARLRAEARAVEAERRLAEAREARADAAAHLERMNRLEVEKARALGEIEEEQFRGRVAALGAGTIAAIARAGPQAQAELLGGLGLSGFMITDGKNPINLFNTAQGMIANGAGGM